MSGRGAQYNFGPATTLREGCLVYGAARPGHVLPSREQASTPRGPDVGDPTVAEWARFMQVCSRSTVCVCVYVCLCARARVCVAASAVALLWGKCPLWVHMLCDLVQVSQCVRTAVQLAYLSLLPALPIVWASLQQTHPLRRTHLRIHIHSPSCNEAYVSPFQPPCLNLPPRRRKASSASCA